MYINNCAYFKSLVELQSAHSEMRTEISLALGTKFCSVMVVQHTCICGSKDFVKEVLTLLFSVEL